MGATSHIWRMAAALTASIAILATFVTPSTSARSAQSGALGAAKPFKPSVLYITSEASGCIAVVDVPYIGVVQLRAGEYGVYEVWPGSFYSEIVYRDDPRAPGQCAFKVRTRNVGLNLGNDPAAFLITVKRPQTEEEDEITATGRRTTVAGAEAALASKRRVRHLTLQDRLGGNTVLGRPFLGEEPHGNYESHGAMTLPEGYFFGRAKADTLVSGELRYFNGDVYQGAFRSTSPNGVGVLATASGETYRGVFVDGKPHGEGVCSTRATAPSSCLREHGATAPLPASTSVATQRVKAEFDMELRELRQERNKNIQALREQAASLEASKADVPRWVKRENDKKIEECACELAGVAPWGRGCLEIIPENRTPAQQDVIRRAQERRSKSCHAWWDRTKGQTVDQQITAELKSIADSTAFTLAQIRSEQAETARLTAELQRRQAAERERRVAALRQEVQAARDEALQNHKKACDAGLARGTDCGCSGYFMAMNIKPPPAKPNSVCPA